MKIGFVLPYASVNYFGGINVQGRMWRDGLESLGHEVFLLNTWDKFDYKSMAGTFGKGDDTFVFAVPFSENC